MTKKTITILSYVAFDSPEGLNRRIKGLLGVLASMNWTVKLYCPNYGISSQDGNIPGSIIHLRCWPRVPKNKLERALSHILYSIALLAKLMISLRPTDIIQIEHQPLAPLIPLLKRRIKRPILIDDFMFMAPFDKGAARFFTYILDMIAVRNASVIVTASQHALSYLIHNNVKHIYAPNGIDEPKFINLPKENSQCLFIGSLHFVQNEQAIRHLFDILENLNKREFYPSVFIVGGPTSKAKRLQREASKRNINVQFTGRISDEDLETILERSGIGLLPFFSDSPTMGGQRIKALEFISYGLTVIAGPEGFRGVDGIIHGTNAIIVENPEVFQDTLISVISSWDKNKYIGVSASQLAHSHVWNITLADWKRLLNNLA